MRRRLRRPPSDRRSSHLPGAGDPSAGHYVFVRDMPGADRIRTRLASAASTFFREQLTA